MALAFRPRLGRIDAILLERVNATGYQAENLETLRGRPAIGLFELFPAEDWLPRHYGKMARALWTLVDEVFKPAHFEEDCPPATYAKSVQVADIFAMPPTIESRKSYLSLAFDSAQPVMVPCPEVAQVLLEPGGSTISETREALHELVWEMTERLNIIAPAARALAAHHHSE